MLQTNIVDLVLLLLPDHLLLEGQNVKIIAFPCNPHVRAAGTEAKTILSQREGSAKATAYALFQMHGTC